MLLLPDIELRQAWQKFRPFGAALKSFGLLPAPWTPR